MFQPDHSQPRNSLETQCALTTYKKEASKSVSASQNPVGSVARDQVRDQTYTTLIGKIADGDHEAVSSLYESTSRQVFGLALRILGDRSTAEEVLLDVYKQVWRQAARYDASRGGPLTWLMTIARTRAIDRLRSERLIPHQSELTDTAGSEPATTPNPETASAVAEMQRTVRSALGSLPTEQREVIELSFFAGMTQNEIALHLGQPLGTVKTRTRSGMIKLRELLAPVMVTQL